MTIAADRPFLVLRTSSIGDVVLASAVIEALAGRFPIVFVTSETCAPLFAEDPRIARLVTLPRGAERLPDDLPPPGALLDLQATIRSARTLRRYRGVPRARVRKAGLRRRLAVLGWTAGWRPIPTHERYVRALERITGQREEAKPRLVVSESKLREAQGTLEEGAPWIGLAPGAAWANKRWPLDRWIAAAREITSRGAHRAAFFFGPDEEALARAAEEMLARSSAIRVVRPELGLLPALAARLSVFVTGDSAPLHVAEAVGTPVVALFGPTVPAFGFAPFRSESRIIERPLPCRPCHVHGGQRCPLGHHRCLRDIAVEEVVGRALEVSRGRAASPLRAG